MSEPRSGNIVNAILAVSGLFGGGGLCFLDAYSSFTGLQAFFSTHASEIGRFWVPLFLSCLTIGFTAFSTEFIEESLHGEHKGAKPGLFMAILFVCIAYDFITSFLGMLCLMTGIESSTQAFSSTEGMQRIVAAFLSVIMVISPFIVGKFIYKIKEDPGIIGRFFRSFGE